MDLNVHENEAFLRKYAPNENTVVCNDQAGNSPLHSTRVFLRGRLAKLQIAREFYLVSIQKPLRLAAFTHCPIKRDGSSTIGLIIRHGLPTSSSTEQIGMHVSFCYEVIQVVRTTCLAAG